jgi:hypothetical protein
VVVLALGKVQEEVPGVGFEGGAQTHGVVDLVGSSVGDVVFDAGDGGGVGLAVNGGGPGDGRFGGSGFGQGDETRRRIESKPEEGESIRRSGLKRFVESRGGFVTEKSRSVPAFVFYEGLNLVQGRQDFIQRLRLNDLMRLGEIQPLIFFSEQEFLFLWFHCDLEFRQTIFSLTEVSGAGTAPYQLNFKRFGWQKRPF